jgi:hypothetical protein
MRRWEGTVPPRLVEDDHASDPAGHRGLAETCCVHRPAGLGDGASATATALA